MALSDSMRRLAKKWSGGAGAQWPKRLDWVSVEGMRGWAGQRVDSLSPSWLSLGKMPPD